VVLSGGNIDGDVLAQLLTEEDKVQCRN
jgi:hypothetical protein